MSEMVQTSRENFLLICIAVKADFHFFLPLFWAVKPAGKPVDLTMMYRYTLHSSVYTQDIGLLGWKHFLQRDINTITHTVYDWGFKPPSILDIIYHMHEMSLQPENEKQQ